MVYECVFEQCNAEQLFRVRPKVTGKSKKRNVLNIETKLEILNRLAKGECGASLAPFYNVVKSTILLKVNNNESSKVPPNADAFSALETTMEWYERQSMLFYSTPAAQENRRLCSEKTMVYNGTVKNT
ncbi:HTH psq-type domain-containing protein [Trichonephila clavipes]|nr:HTH psq-type domain-containing protein [Trichonephila clavipes]